MGVVTDFGQLVSLMEKFKLSHGFQIPDAIIGAPAVVNQALLFTCNTKDFNFIPGITLR